MTHRGAAWDDDSRHDPLPQHARPSAAPSTGAGASSTLSFGTFIVAIAEGRRNEVGIAAMDVATPDIFVSQFCDSTQSYRQTVSFIFRYQPLATILLSNSCSKRWGEVAQYMYSGDAAVCLRCCVCLRVVMGGGGSRWVALGTSVPRNHSPFYLISL